MNKQRIFALFLSLVLALCLLPVSAAAANTPLLNKLRTAPPFRDVRGTIYEKAAQTVYETSLMEAGGKQVFKPQGPLMMEQVVIICARLHDFLTGGDGEMDAPAKSQAWYQPFYDYLGTALHYKDGSAGLWRNYRPTYPASLCTLTELLADTLNAANCQLPVLNSVSIIPNTTDHRIYSLYNSGIYKGADAYGGYSPYCLLTRGEAALILARVIDPAQRLSFSLKTFDHYAMLGVKPVDVLFTINGEAIKAEQAIYLMAKSITSTYYADYSFATAEAYTLNSIKKVYAYRILAKERGIALSEEDLSQADKEALASSLSLSTPRESQLWYTQHEALRKKVKASYVEEFGSNPYNGFSKELSADLAAAMDKLSLERTVFTGTKPLGAFRVKLIDSPFYDYRERYEFNEE